MVAVLSRFTLIVTLCLAVPIGATHFISSAQSAPILTLFTNPDGTSCTLPCLFGIRPGETPYGRAVQLLGKHPFTHNFKQNTKLPIFLGTFNGHPMGVVLTSGGNDQVLLIELTRIPDDISDDPFQSPGWELRGGRSGLAWGSLGEVVSVLGAPDLVGVDGKSTRSYYIGDQLMFYHYLSTQGYVTVDQPFDALFVFARQLKLTPSQLGITSWRGFGNARRYLMYSIP